MGWARRGSWNCTLPNYLGNILSHKIIKKQARNSIFIIPQLRICFRVKRRRCHADMDSRLVRRPHAFICRFFLVERADAGRIRAVRLANWPLKHTISKALLLFLAQTQTLLPGYPFIYTKIRDISPFEGSVMPHETSWSDGGLVSRGCNLTTSSLLLEQDKV